MTAGINIAYCTDANGFNYLVASLESLIATNHDNECPLNIYILHDGVSIKKQKLLTAIYDGRANIKFIDGSSIIDYDSLFVNDKFHLPKATYFRFYLPQLIPDIDKILYIDIDTIIMDSVKELFSVELDDKYIAACPEKGRHTLDYRVRLDTLDAEYFNCGIMLLNLKKMREENFSQAIIEFLKNFKYEICYADQDVMNKFIGNDYKRIGYKWNQFSNAFIPLYKESLVHLAGPNKHTLRHWEKFKNNFLGSRYVDLAKKNPLAKFFYNRDDETFFRLSTQKLLVRNLFKNIIKKFKKSTPPPPHTHTADLPMMCGISTSSLQHLSKKLFPEQKIKYGPFASFDIKLPFNEFENNIPYILGICYSELDDIIKEIKDISIENIVIFAYYGSYLSLVLAKIIPNVKIYYFYKDDPERRYIEMSFKDNNLYERIGFSNSLEDFYKTQNLKKTLYVINLIFNFYFTLDDSVFIFPSNSYLLIEFTDCYNLNSINLLIKSLEKTHDVKIIRQNSFVEQVLRCKYEEINKFEIDSRSCLMQSNVENRYWIFARPLA